MIVSIVILLGFGLCWVASLMYGMYEKCLYEAEVDNFRKSWRDGKPLSVGWRDNWKSTDYQQNDDWIGNWQQKDVWIDKQDLKTNANLPSWLNDLD